ncbi:MAG: serine/threonine protein phosphatase [Bacteroidales bacterium]|nr:serine/threonine protein phosphatase [Bacteroidales bacterium]
MRYAIGDIHGCYKSLRKLVEDILEIKKEDELYFVGDFIDRGPSGKEVIDYIISLMDEGYRVHSVRGNHEEMLIDAYLYKTPDKYMLWMFNGADATLASYGIESYKFRDEAVLSELPESHMDFIRKMPYYIELKDYIIVHAGINFKAEEPFKDIRSMIWCRDCSNDLSLSGNRYVVHGHTPIALNQIQRMAEGRNEIQLNIDAGCVYKGFSKLGNLAALDLDNLKVYHTENMDF